MPESAVGWAIANVVSARSAMVWSTGLFLAVLGQLNLALRFRPGLDTQATET